MKFITKLSAAMVLAAVGTTAATAADMANEMTIVSWGGAYSTSQMKRIMSHIWKRPALKSSMMKAPLKQLRNCALWMKPEM
nr:hypothetical protein [Sneathiella glossodoripedis]